MTNYRVRCLVYVDYVVFAEVSPGTVERNASWYQGLVGEEVEPLVRAASTVLQAVDGEVGDDLCHWLELCSGVG